MQMLDAGTKFGAVAMARLTRQQRWSLTLGTPA